MFRGDFFSGKGDANIFSYTIIVFATADGMCVSVKLVNQESMRQQCRPISSLFKLVCA